MDGTIANELYSEILQSSSVEFDRGSTAAQASNNLNVSKNDDAGDLWYDEESSEKDSTEKLNAASDMEREWQKRRNQFHTIGYRDGVIAGKEAAAQEGFNIGFKDSVLNGYNWGFVRGITSAIACLPGGLKEKLVETEEMRNKFQSLQQSVQSLSTIDALKLFYEDGKRKSSNGENSSGVLENYHGQLQSLLGESPLLDGHSERK
ncbi:hypothetical protein ABFS82_02G113300 [Erythranthe guttata]|uniref:Essential protein Yae1 N-terminal domain-containing protein n=1 Tax=Erythranthe guttata TaxID=4155 RepID=A0A022RDY3_ERYGU|nr:PREDICTED: uncharacterized protein LOC105957038 [Erythranthe guttata]EYU38259.1 hypothetical protein MIMGU_mgv1a013976mg [Erythranthe guttata]|eukprot:XP_012836405.1 PREDICTED: uncharacterized protein LOC105957038 [Erythranthe guttata]